MIDPDALWVTHKLREAGFEAYVVGGAVRDLLVGKTPKDFDICTDANPRRVRRIFRNSRIIGRRFRLVHVYFSHQKYLEVSTFRSAESGDGQNIYGTLDEDPLRRDFTLNTLYYCPRDEYVIDYLGAFKDIKKGKIRPVIPLKTIFVEDPVRILRCLKYKVTINFDLTFRLKRRVKKDASYVANCSVSRLTEELFKVLSCGSAKGIIATYYEYGVLKYFIPEIARFMDQGSRKKTVLNSLEKLDKHVHGEGEDRRSRMIYYLLKPLWDKENFDQVISKERFNHVLKFSKNCLSPLIAANKDIEGAMRYYFRKNKWPTTRPLKRKKPL